MEHAEKSRVALCEVLEVYAACICHRIPFPTKHVKGHFSTSGTITGIWRRLWVSNSDTFRNKQRGSTSGRLGAYTFRCSCTPTFRTGCDYLAKCQRSCARGSECARERGTSCPQCFGTCVSVLKSRSCKESIQTYTIFGILLPRNYKSCVQSHINFFRVCRQTWRT